MHRRFHPVLSVLPPLAAMLPLAGCVVGHVPGGQQPYPQEPYREGPYEPGGYGQRGGDHGYGGYQNYDPAEELDVFRLSVEGNAGDGDRGFEDGAAPDLVQTNEGARIRATGEGYFDEDRMVGFGVTVEGWRTEPTAFGGGAGFGGIDGRLRRFSVTPHLSLQAQPADIFQIRGRVGPTFVRHEFEDFANAEGSDIFSFGLRLEAEPELFLVRGYGADFSLFARGTFGAYNSFIELQQLPDEDFFSSAAELQATLGGKLRIQNLFLTAGYTWERTFFNESDEENGLVVLENDFGFEGLMFGGGIVF